MPLKLVNPGLIVFRSNTDVSAMINPIIALLIVSRASLIRPGFPAAVLEQLFTRFVTTKVAGTGLGLAISKRLIEEHRGRIEASNVPTGGARVTFWLPSAEEDR